jgi:hypothetical protein
MSVASGDVSERILHAAVSPSQAKDAKDHFVCKEMLQGIFSCTSYS